MTVDVFVLVQWSPRRTASSFLVASALVAAACGSGGGSAGGPDGQTSAGGETSEATADASGSALTGEFATIDGGSINLADFDGEDVVLWFWAPW